MIDNPTAVAPDAEQVTHTNSKGGRGVYDRTPITCSTCGKVLKGHGAYVLHQKAHVKNAVNGTRKEDIRSLASTLRTLARWLSTGQMDDEQVIDSLVSELDKSEHRIDIALRMLSLQRVERICRLTQRLEIIDEAFDKKLSERNLNGIPMNELLEMSNQIEGSMARDFKLLQELQDSGPDGSDRKVQEIFNLLLQRSMAGHSRVVEAVIRAGGDNQAPLVIPTDPVKREELRRAALTIKMAAADGNK